MRRVWHGSASGAASTRLDSETCQQGAPARDLALFLYNLPVVEEPDMNERDAAAAYLETRQEMLVTLTKDIWEHPQVGFEEMYAADRHAAALEAEGFSLSRATAGLRTAFVGEWGSGAPVIAILGEYDALPGLSQEVAATRQPVVPGAPGHACGHNLLGTAALGAALAAKHAMEAGRIPGTVRYFGCPAEETLMGKVFMAREGAFDGLDAVLTWHPMYANTLWAASSAALNSFKLSFHGRSAHAAGAPESGRSALDAVLLTDVGVNYLREHIIPDARIHCVVTHGGEAPNIVPSYAQSWYYVRAPKRTQVESIYERVLNVARGAALMTETTLETELVTACYDFVPNDAIQQVLLRNMKHVGAPVFTQADVSFARELQATLPAGAVEDALQSLGKTRDELGDPLCSVVLDEVGTLRKGTVQPVSTDVGDVSYIVPTAQFTACCMPLGVPLHSWQAVASCGSRIGFTSMLFAARVLALTALDLLGDPAVLREARSEHDRATGGGPYRSPIPAELKAPGQS